MIMIWWNRTYHYHHYNGFHWGHTGHMGPIVVVMFPGVGRKCALSIKGMQSVGLQFDNFTDFTSQNQDIR